MEYLLLCDNYGDLQDTMCDIVTTYKRLYWRQICLRAHDTYFIF